MTHFSYYKPCNDSDPVIDPYALVAGVVEDNAELDMDQVDQKKVRNMVQVLDGFLAYHLWKKE